MRELHLNKKISVYAQFQSAHAQIQRGCGKLFTGSTAAKTLV